MALKHNAQLVCSEVGGCGFSGAPTGVNGEWCSEAGCRNLKSLIFMPASH